MILIWALILLAVSYLLNVSTIEGFQSFVDWRARYRDISPRERLPEIIREFGSPDLIDPSAGGGAIWFKKTLRSRGKKYEQVLILDEAVPHASPSPHADFFYIQVRLPLNKNKISEVLGLSKSVQYDPLKQVLTVRCHFSGANKATMYLAVKIAQGQLTLKEVQDKNLYSETIMRTVPGTKFYDPDAEHEYEAYIFEFINSLEDQAM